ncbi:MAG: two-component regulator propeller domain-containing protein [Bacteroidota bacterium]
MSVVYPDMSPTQVSLRNRPFFWLVLSFLFLSELTIAQPRMMFKRYSVQDGLSHNYARKVIQDSEGFIWIATEDGLNKFNGYTFQIYKNIPGDTTSLSNHPTTTVAEDKDHNIWIGTWGGGLFKYNRKRDNFQHITPVSGKDNSGSSNYIYDLFKDSHGRMWVGTNGNGLFLINTNDYTYTHFQHNPNNPASLSHDRVSAIKEDNNANLWIGTIGGGVNHFNPTTGIFKHYLHTDSDARSLSHNDVYCVFYDHQQRLWVGTWDYGLNLMEQPANGFTHFSTDSPTPNNLGSNQIWTIAEDQEGQIWIGTDDGLAFLNDKEKTFHVYKNDPFDSKSLAANSIKSLYCDKQGRLWVGSVNNGLCLFDKYLIQMGHHYRKLNDYPLSNNDVTAFLQDSKGKILVGTDGGGLNQFDQRKDHFIHYQHDNHNPKSIGGNKIKTLLLDHRQRVWIGFWGAGLDYFDQDRKTFTHFRKGTTDAKGQLTNNNITCMAEDQDGYLWLGTFGGGLNKFDPDRKTFQSYTQHLNDPKSLSDKYIWAVLIDHLNNIWVGTSNGGLNLFDRKREQFINIPLQKPEEAGYPVQVLFEDSKRRIWVGLEGGGLKLLDQKTLTFRSFNKQNGLPNDNINSIEEAPNGFLWLGTNHGIVRFDPKTGHCKTYEISDGTQGLHFNRQASRVLSTGELLFGGNNGFNVFHPDSLKEPVAKVPLIFTDFQIFNKPVPIGVKDSPLEAQINQTNAITLSYKQSVFSLEYAGINFTAPEKMQYKYRLKGFVDESWQEAGNTRKVMYTNLAPGQYTFEVAGSKDNQVLTPIRSLSITISPPWWQTRLTRLLAFILTCTSLFAIYYLRSRSIRQQNTRLEKEVAERTLALQQANQSLKALNQLIQEQKEEIQSQAEELVESNDEIKTINLQLEERVELRTSDLKKTNEELDNFVYRVSHDIRAPLSSVLGLVELIENEKDPSQLKLYLKMVTKCVNKLDGFVKDILNYSRNSRMKVNREEIRFQELFDTIREELQYMENAQRIQFLSELTITVPHYNDVRRLHIVFHNFFSNTIKYQNLREDSPCMKIAVNTTPEAATIVITDNGIGIDTPQIKRVFDMFYRGSELSNGSGLGLYIVKETIEKLSGSIHVQSQFGKGTVFTIRLPNSHPEA